MPPGIAAVDKPIIITFLAMEKVIFRFVLYKHRSRRNGSDGSEIFFLILLNDLLIAVEDDAVGA